MTSRHSTRTVWMLTALCALWLALMASGSAINAVALSITGGVS